MMDIPAPPAGRPRATAPVALRFEDVAQDGRLVLEALPTALGSAVWRGLLADSAGVRALRAQGIVPILTRLRLLGTAGPFSAGAAVEAEGTYRLARADDGRFMLEMWADLYAPIGRTYGRTDRDGERALAGRVLAEHVFTRPFAGPNDRRVTSFDFPGAPEVRDARPALPPFESIATLPEGALPLEPARRPDSTPAVFGVVHTDSNMHVNSLVYLRLFEEAALRRFVALGRGSEVLARSVDIAYRKPCLAGQSMRVVQQAFDRGRSLAGAGGGSDGDGASAGGASGAGGFGADLGVAAVLVAESDAQSDETLARARPHTYVRMGFER
jgi:hypothetical protein